MEWKFDDGRAIYSQIVEQMKLFIVSGLLPAGSKLPAVRELAQEASVNPNTMQRALSELEFTGLVYTNRTSGRFVTDDSEKIAQANETLAQSVITDFLERMEKLGYSKDETKTLISNIQNGGENNE